MATFEVELPHTEAECLAALVDQARNPETLPKLVWGCRAGTHVGWGTLEAANENAARQLISRVLRDKAKVTPVETFTAGQIKERSVGAGLTCLPTWIRSDESSQRDGQLLAA